VFGHARAAAPAGPVLPLVLSHGWPDSFWRYAKVIPLLTDPGAHGTDPADAFDVVVRESLFCHRAPCQAVNMPLLDRAS